MDRGPVISAFASSSGTQAYLTRTSRGESPLVLVSDEDGWFGRSLETVLSPAGYRVVRAETPPQTMEQARRHRPDAIVVSVSGAGAEAFGLCRALRADPAVSLATPIIVTTPEVPTRGQQLQALRAGAWQLIGQPVDAEEFLLRLGAFVAGKRETDRAEADVKNEA